MKKLTLAADVGAGNLLEIYQWGKSTGTSREYLVVQNTVGLRTLERAQEILIPDLAERLSSVQAIRQEVLE